LLDGDQVQSPHLSLVAVGAVTVVNTADATMFTGPVSGYFIIDDASPNLSMLYWDATGGSGSDAVALATFNGVTSLLPFEVHVV
jgi:hypothetical protein